MALFSVPQLKAAAQVPLQFSREARYKSASAILESAKQYPIDHWFDVFLSHKFSDLELAVGLKRILEQYGYSVYVDSEIDKQLNRATATKSNARILKSRMEHSRCLVVATTEHFQESVWIPWEVGYVDGKGGLIAVAPVTAAVTTSDAYKGSEYFGLYPHLAETGIAGTSEKALWVYEHIDRYARFEEWLDRKPFRDRPK